MPIKINGTTVINETLLADINLSNLSETGQNVIKSLISSEGGMKRPDYANGSMKNITVSGTDNKGNITNVSYTSVTIASAGYISNYNILSSYNAGDWASNPISITNQIVKINNTILPIDAFKGSLIPVSTNDVITFTSTLSGGSSMSSKNFSFNICQFMFYPEL